jgi:hypothetical protein
VVRKLTDIVKLQVRLSERLRRRLEQAANHNDWSMNTEIVSRLDTSFQKDELEKMMALAFEQAVTVAATATAGKLVQEFRLGGRDLTLENTALPHEGIKHPSPPDKEEKLK